MKKIITALSNQIVNEKLKKYNEIEIITNDIQYQEGILEILEINKEIDFIILSELLPGKLDIKNLIEEIKKINNKIKIIIILEKQKEELENYLSSKKNISIFYNNQIEINEIAKIIINEKDKEQLKKEIEKLKEIINNNKIDEQNNRNQKEANNKINEQNNINKDEIIKIKNKKDIEIKINKIDEFETYKEIFEKDLIDIEKEIKYEYEENNKLNFILNLKANKNNNKNNNKNAKIIIISGLSGVGKSVFTINLAKAFKENNKKILIIDFDIFNNSIQTLLGISKQQNKTFNNTNNLKEIIAKINKKIELLLGIDLILNKKNQINNELLLKILNELKQNYDVIIIDTSAECFYDYNQILMKNSDKIIFLSEANILQIKKSQKLLNIYIIEWKIEKEKINIIFNKNKDDNIDFNILKEIFKEINIMGKIDNIKNCNTLINQNMNNIFVNKKIKKEYIKISKNILKNNKLKQYYLNKIINEQENKNGIRKN